MKRIAIELYGLTRSYKETFDSFFFNLLQPLYNSGYIVDIFIHTWSESDSNDITWHNPTGENRGQNMDEIQYNDIIEKYRPKKIIVDYPLDIPKELVLYEKLANKSRSYNSFISCFYSRFISNELRIAYEKENNIVYDKVILTRFDISFDKPFILDHYIKTYCEHTKMNIPANTVLTACSPWRMCSVADSANIECCTDLIVISNSFVMNQITRLYEDINKKYITKKFINENNYNIEVLWRKYWQLKGLEHIKIKYIESEDFHIVRCKSQDHPQNENLSNTQKYRRKLKNNIKDIWLYFRPFFVWLSQIFSIFYYLFKIFFKICMRIKACI